MNLRVKTVVDMYTNIEITTMKLCHIEAIHCLEKECFSEPWSFEALKEELSNKNAHFVVALSDNELLGYCGMYSVLDEGYITNIAVFPRFRGNKISKRLLAYIFKYCRDSHLSFLSLEVRASNFAAIKLYENTGFEKLGIRKNFYNYPKEDAVIMTKYF